MARRNTRSAKRAPQRRRRRGGRNARITLGGPNASREPSIRYVETGSFDLPTDPTSFGCESGCAPVAMSIYAVCPRDTATYSVSNPQQQAMVTYEIYGKPYGSNTQVVVQNGQTILPFNAGKKLVFRIQFSKLFAAGLSVPVATIGGKTYLGMGTLTLLNDTGDEWGGTSISCYTVFEYEQIQTYFSKSVVFALTGATTATYTNTIDVDFKPGRIMTNNAVGGYRSRAFIQVTDDATGVRPLRDRYQHGAGPSAISSSPSEAGAAEAHPSQ